MADARWLLEQVFAAESRDQLRAFLADHTAEVLAAFPNWTKVPQAMRGDAGAVDAWARRIIQVAEILAELGQPGPLARIQGDVDTNPIYRLQDTLARARALAELGRYAESTAALTGLLPEFDRLSGI